MKIVLGTHHYPPTFVAGVELLTQRLASWLVTRGHSVEVVTIEDIDSDGPLSVRTDVQDGVRVHRLALHLTGGLDPLSVRYRDESIERWFLDYLAHAQPDLFHSQSSYLLTASLLDAAHRFGTPTIASLHDYWYLCPRIILLRPNGARCDSKVSAADCARCVGSDYRRRRIIEGAREKLGANSTVSAVLGDLTRDTRLEEIMMNRQNHLDSTLRSVDQIVTPAVLTRELLLDRGFSPQHVRLVRQGLKRLATAPNAELNHHDELRIGYLGQLAAHKGVHVLIEAFRQLNFGSRGAQLKIYGDLDRFPKYVSGLRQMASGVPNIRFEGTYANDKVWQVLRDLDVLVVPSLWYEISPLVILEAFAAGVPVIASDLRNMNYQVHDSVDGFLFEAGKSAALKQDLQRLIDDPGLLPRLRKGIQPVYDVEHELREIEQIYRDVISAKTSAGRATAQVVV